MKQPTLWWLAKSQELLAEMLAARSDAKRQGLTGPTFTQYMDERVAIWLQRTFETAQCACCGGSGNLGAEVEGACPRCNGSGKDPGFCGACNKLACVCMAETPGRGTPEGPCVCAPGDAACISYNCATAARRRAREVGK